MKTITKIILIFLAMLSIEILAQDLYNKFSPSEWWFEYYEPKVAPVVVGDSVEFSSFSEYKRDVNVEWYEVLWCKRNDGTIRRGYTQYSHDFKKKGDVSIPNATWVYKDFPDREDVISCMLCGDIIVKTPSTILSPKGYIKSDTFCTDNFEY